MWNKPKWTLPPESWLWYKAKRDNLDLKAVNQNSKKRCFGILLFHAFISLTENSFLDHNLKTNFGWPRAIVRIKVHYNSNWQNITSLGYLHQTIAARKNQIHVFKVLYDIKEYHVLQQIVLVNFYINRAIQESSIFNISSQNTTVVEKWGSGH